MHKEGSVSLVTLSSVFAAPRPAGGGGAGSEERDPPRHKGNVVSEEKDYSRSLKLSGALRGSLPWI